MDKATVNPVIMQEDVEKIKQDLDHIDKNILPYCGDIQRAFEDLKVLKLDSQYLSDVLFNGCEKALHDFAEIRFKGLKSTLKVLFESCEKAGCSELLQFLSISNNGNIVFSETSKDALKAKHRKYLSTPEGIERYKLHEAAVEAINKFIEAMGEKYDGMDILDSFDIDDHDRLIATPLQYE